MIYERLPDYFPLNDQLPNWKKITVSSAAAVIAISESTKNDLIEILNVPAEKITVIHHGIEQELPLATQTVPNLPANFILFVGERSNYKNFFRFINCCGQLANVYPDLHFVFAGGGPFQILDSHFIARLNLQSKCIQLNVSDEQLNYLYQNATLFIFPSLYEGFGLPILEAFRAGCPVAASNTSCFPEVGGDAVSYFDPLNEQDMLVTLKKLLHDSNYRNGQIAKGLARVKLFPLHKQITETIALYKKVANVDNL
jgi:glycosyltransferase involved in cell wall biosynthesis